MEFGGRAGRGTPCLCTTHNCNPIRPTGIIRTCATRASLPGRSKHCEAGGKEIMAIKLGGERLGINTKRHSAIPFFKQTQLLAPLRTATQCQALKDHERVSEWHWTLAANPAMFGGCFSQIYSVPRSNFLRR